MTGVFTAWIAVPTMIAVTAAGRQAAAFEGLMWMIALLVVVALGSIGLWCLGRRIRAKNATKEASFTVGELRDMRDGGSVTSDEYETLRRQAVKDFQAGADQQD